MLIVISDSELKPGKATLVNELFRAGLDLFHIRKYEADESELIGFVRAIDPEYRTRLVLNHHHDLGVSLGLKRFHYSERDRKKWEDSKWTGVDPEKIYSTSVHSMEEYNGLPEHFSYAFLSPVFDSISKPGYLAESFDFSIRKESPAKLIGLGGIQADNAKEAIDLGFDGVALLGAIWKSENPINSLKEIKSEL
ncbi:thiamine phosphate synthase [Fluviicola sp.]|uniref:thiamine phosphate synthase n=1 Tax=Fluviicola sp. TaxID=1917219 RepID=UPI002621D962|nr:thiamine phosphate synthase [Fluviicola sp.]